MTNPRTKNPNLRTLLTKKARNRLSCGLKDENENGNVLTYLDCDCNAKGSKENADKLVQECNRNAQMLKISKGRG